MVEPLRHRQTKGAETDMPGLPPPRHIQLYPARRLTPATAKVGFGACVTNAPSEYDGAELYER